MQQSSRWFVIVAMVGLSAGTAFGDLVLPVGEDPINTWDIGQVTLVLGEQFMKYLEFNEDKDNSGFVDMGDLGAFQAQPMLLIEQIEIGQDSAPWRDWHEEFLFPNWAWSSVIFSAPGLTNLGESNTGGVIDFTFGPLPPGTVIDITKEMIYTGDPLDLFPSFGGPPSAGPPINEVLEYPTPEPATMSLLALGAVAVLCRRRRR